ncbi:MAG TPA: Ig-like domain-containing protein, partial [Chthoniobacteraceae bacterium]|nr:Ig-like domain-containing protein [Chthoniobacteraceae bacterium]
IYMIDIATGESELTYQKTWTAEPVNQVPTVQIVSPVDGAHFLFGNPIQLRASASDLDGELRGVEFLANGSRIGAGVQENQTGFFSLQWNPQGPGPYLITAEAFDDAGGKGNSQSVGVTVHQPQPIVVSVRTVDPEAVEGPVDGSVDNAEFEISRSDDLLRDVTVYFSLHGTATPAVDYQSVSNFVRIPAGVANVRVTIAPIADRNARVENMETVVLRIEPVPSESGPVPPYTIDSQQREAAAVIYERSIPQEGKLEIALPSDGELFELGEPIRILVAASSPTPITQVEFKANGQHIGTSVYNPLVGGGGFAIEAEDFDFDAGEHMPAADFMPYTGGAYEQVGAVHNVDYFRRVEVLEGDVYRVNESPNVPMLVSQEATNTDRGTWNVEVNYRLGWVDDGAWMNYTRNFPNGFYRVYAGLTHGDQNVTMRATLGKVTAGLGSIDQVVEPLGEFSGPGTGSWTTSRRVPLTSSGDEALVMLGGEQTLRFQGNTGDFDYLLLEPVTIAAPPRLIWHEFLWTNAPAGTNVISAEAVLPNGMRISTSAIRVRVGPEQRASFVLRDLPDSYSPGAPFTVTLRATPPPGTHAFAIEDSAPAGWVVSEISHDGVFDRVTGKVKFGPFTDSQGRDPSYRATPPTNASGRVEFVGSSSRDGVLYPIFGDQVIVGNSRFHPADRNQNSSVEIAELTAYAAAWKAGDSWPTGPSPILANYATRAGRLWRAGEAYRFEPRIPAPLCWTPLNEFVPSGSIELVEASRATAERSAASLVAPGETTDITVRIVPSVGSSAYAVEERIPAGWAVRFVSDGGIFDEVRRIVRWGVFLDSNPRTFTYSLSAPSNVTSVAALAGTVSIDGASMDVIGAGRIVGGSESTAVTLTPRHTNTGGVELRIDAAAGQTGVLESSTDLVNWVEIQPVHNANGSVNVTNSAVGSDQLRFYRFKVQ